MEKQEILQCLRWLSNIEWYVMKNGWISDDIISEHFDYITNMLHSLLK